MIEQLGRGPHLRLGTPPDTWDGVDRPFIQVPVTSISPAGDHPDHRPRALVALELVSPLVAWVVSRRGTRAELGRALALHARQALEPEPLGRGVSPAIRRRLDLLRQPDRDQLVAEIRRIHHERQGQDLRVGVVDWAEILVAGVRALGASGYNPAGIEWIPVFGWLPGEAS